MISQGRAKWFCQVSVCIPECDWGVGGVEVVLALVEAGKTIRAILDYDVTVHRRY